MSNMIEKIKKISKIYKILAKNPMAAIKLEEKEAIIERL